MLQRADGTVPSCGLLKTVTATGAEAGRRGDPAAAQTAVHHLEGRRLTGCGAPGAEIVALILESAEAGKELVLSVIE